MKTKNILLIITALLLVNVNASYSGVINNGDFQSCDFQNWQKDTDGYGDPGATGDFSINNNAGECNAQVSVDDADGVSVFDAGNTLFTALDLTIAAGALQLSFDWDFSGFDLSDNLSDFFSVSLRDSADNLFGADGNAGHLMAQTFDYGSGTFSTLLDSSFNNQSDWSLEFVVQPGWNVESFSSKLIIDNVSLTAVATEVPEPSTLVILLIAVVGLFSQQRRFVSRG